MHSLIIYTINLFPKVLIEPSIKVSKENQLRDELLKGTLLRDAYNKYGVL